MYKMILENILHNVRLRRDFLGEIFIWCKKKCPL